MLEDSRSNAAKSSGASILGPSIERDAVERRLELQLQSKNPCLRLRAFEGGRFSADSSKRHVGSRGPVIGGTPGRGEEGRPVGLDRPLELGPSYPQDGRHRRGVSSPEKGGSMGVDRGGFKSCGLEMIPSPMGSRLGASAQEGQSQVEVFASVRSNALRHGLERGQARHRKSNEPIGPRRRDGRMVPESGRIATSCSVWAVLDGSSWSLESARRLLGGARSQPAGGDEFVSTISGPCMAGSSYRTALGHLRGAFALRAGRQDLAQHRNRLTAKRVRLLIVPSPSRVSGEMKRCVEEFLGLIPPDLSLMASVDCIRTWGALTPYYERRPRSGASLPPADSTRRHLWQSGA